MNKFNDFIEEQGIKKRFIASKLGITYQHLGVVLSKKKPPSVSLAKKIEKFTAGKIKFYEFFEEENDTHICPTCGQPVKENFKIKKLDE